MSKFKKIALVSGAAVVLLALGIIVALVAAPPDLLRIAANYTAKIVCSNVFIAGREPGEVLNDDVQSPGASVLRLMRVSVDRDRGVVRAGLLGFIGDGLAMAHPGVGCTVVPDGKLAGAVPPAPRSLAPRILKHGRRPRRPAQVIIDCGPTAMPFRPMLRSINS